MLTHEQLHRYGRDGFLDVTEPFLSAAEITDARERIDNLFERWSTLSSRVRAGNSDTPPLTARIFRVTGLDPGIARGQLVKSCQEIAASIVGRRHVWCRFDAAIYKYPGAGQVLWHQDIALSMTRMSPHSVHFWIPLNDHDADSGSMAFIPGSHLTGRAEHRRAEGGGLQMAADPVFDGNVVSVPLSVGNFSLHGPLTMHKSNSNGGRGIRKALTLEFSPGPWSAARQLGRPLVRVMG